MVVVCVTPGTAAALATTALLKFPAPLPVVTRRSARTASSTLALADLDSEAPNTDIAATRARPTMSAEAVWAVRRGLRIEFSRPSWPATPSTRASGRPITLEIGRAIAGDNMATPTKMRTAPTPTSAMTGLASPTASSAAPARATAAPQINRRLSEPSPADDWSLSAAIGGMRTALRAGPIAATTVTPTPTASPTSTVRSPNNSDPGGSGGDPPRVAAGADRAHARHADADRQPYQHGPQPEHQRSGGQRDPEPA